MSYKSGIALGYLATTIDLDELARFQVESEEGSRSATGSLSTDLCRCVGCTSDG